MLFFFFNDTATTEIYTYCHTLSLHDALPISRIDFLKIDVEGFDFFVIKGIDWDGVTPDVILWEFEDAKTLPLGYSSRDAYSYLVHKGYQVTISEWHPIGE